MANGFAVTHVLDVSRSDDSVFDVDATEHLRNSLFFALAFATGRIVTELSGIGLGHDVILSGRPPGQASSDVTSTRGSPG